VALDPALAGLLGALVGGAAAFGATLVSNNQQARREQDKQRRDRKVEAYGNSLRSLVRAAYYFPLPGGDSRESRGPGSRTLLMPNTGRGS
jgi:hypothetical protein